MNVQEIIENLEVLEQEGKVREFDYYEGHENEEAAAHDDGFIWVEEVDKWVQVD